MNVKLFFSPKIEPHYAILRWCAADRARSGYLTSPLL